jgi:ATP-dependent DNA ligase
MRPLRIPEPFDHPDFPFEPKLDGFRALAHVTGHHCTLVSRNGHVFQSWPQLAEEVAHSFGLRSVAKKGSVR